MADRSKIEWTDASWTPIRARDLMSNKTGWHCEHVTTGCEHCYAERMNKRLGTGLPFKPGLRSQLSIFLDEDMLTAPLRWRKPRMIFVCSMSDLFAEFVKDEWIDRVFAVMALCPQHTFQVLTKRAARMREYIGGHAFAISNAIDCMTGGERMLQPWPLPNVWLGVSCERQPEADARIPLLLQTPAAVRFVSAEPLLGPIDLRNYLDGREEHGVDMARAVGSRVGCCVGWTPPLDWVIVGGESGPDARPMHPDWARSLRDQCVAARVSFFFKQWGEYVPVGNDLSGCAKYLTRSGILVKEGDPGYRDSEVVDRVGKKRAGRLLDGIEHNGMPGRQMQEAAA
jgi:protein gp37